MSLSQQPLVLQTVTEAIFAPGATPLIEPFAATIPATWVPCPLLSPKEQFEKQFAPEIQSMLHVTFCPCKSG